MRPVERMGLYGGAGIQPRRMMLVEYLIRATCRPPAGANEFAAGKSQSPPARTRRHAASQAPARPQPGDHRIRSAMGIIRRTEDVMSACAESWCGSRRSAPGRASAGEAPRGLRGFPQRSGKSSICRHLARCPFSTVRALLSVGAKRPFSARRRAASGRAREKARSTSDAFTCCRASVTDIPRPFTRTANPCCARPCSTSAQVRARWRTGAARSCTSRRNSASPRPARDAGPRTCAAPSSSGTHASSRRCASHTAGRG